MIQQPSVDAEIANQNLLASDQFQGWMDSVTTLLNILEVLQGAGSPNGVVYADIGKTYYNTTGGAGTLLYVKTTAKTSNVGWIAYG